MGNASAKARAWSSLFLIYSPEPLTPGTSTRPRTSTQSRFDLRLRLAQETEAAGEGAPLSAHKGEVGGCHANRVDVVYHHIRVLPIEKVDHRSAYREEIVAEAEFLLEAEVEGGVIGKALVVRRSHQKLLLIDAGEGIAGAVFKKVRDINAPEAGGKCAPGKHTVRRVPGERAALLGRKIQLPEHGIEILIGVGL